MAQLLLTTKDIAGQRYNTIFDWSNFYPHKSAIIQKSMKENYKKSESSYYFLVKKMNAIFAVYIHVRENALQNLLRVSSSLTKK